MNAAVPAAGAGHHGASPEMHRRSALAWPRSGRVLLRSGNEWEAGMRAITLGMAMAAALTLAGCATQPAAPPAPVAAPEAPPPAPPPPLPLPPPPPPPTDWRDLALTPGDWAYRAEPSGSAAEFGAAAPVFTLRCLPAARQVVLERAGAAAGARLVIRTSFGERAVAAGAPLPAADPFFDQMAFSRGRFTVASDGLPMLVIPSWPEPARTVEDCRA
jgi:hypothetical protein